MIYFGSQLENTIHHGMDSGQEEGEAAGYIVSPVGKQRAMWAGAQLAFSFYSVPKSSSQGVATQTQDRITLLTSFKPFWKHLQRHIEGCVSMVILNQIQCTTILH